MLNNLRMVEILLFAQDSNDAFPWVA